MVPKHLIFKSWLLLDIVLTIMSSSVSAEQPLFSASANRKELSLTHMVYHGSAPRYERAPSSGMAGEFADMIGGHRHDGYPWKQNIVTTVFWIGEQAGRSNPVANTQSAWDLSWGRHYGGYDNPNERENFIPVRFIPRLNPFYVALPYNDVEHSHTKIEAPQVIPWFRNSFVRDGESVCKDRWIAIRHGNRTCYAQWEDVGPFRVDHWQYVFGNDRPLPNRNHNAGLDVSPAVRDFLGMSGMDACDWKFVNVGEVPNGPWILYGSNNTVAQLRRQVMTVIAKK